MLFQIILAICVSSTLLYGLKLSPSLNPRPVIGILTAPLPFGKTDPNTSYIVGSYISQIESGGARVAPVLYNSTTDELEKAFNNLNGLLLMGGMADLSPRGAYYRTVRFFVHKSIEAFNKSGEVFPIWGTCLGFQAILVAINNDKDDILVKHQFDHMDRAGIIEPSFFWNATMSSPEIRDAELLSLNSSFNDTELPRMVSAATKLSPSFSSLMKDRENPPFFFNH
eukprot:Filipodium_phascolosomae@DN1067_c0_g1_i5.p1